MLEAPPDTHIYLATDLQIEVLQALSQQRHFFEPYLNGHTISLTKCYAITLTIPEGTRKYIQEREGKVIDYLYFLLERYNMPGQYVLEHTRKGVEHIHGVCYSKDIQKYTKHSMKSKGAITYTYVHPEYPYEHTIKEITSNIAFTGWSKYIIKCLVHPNVIEFFNRLS